MKLETVSIDDVYPDPNNPRKKFEEIESLAASFDLNEERPGEPFTPPILVRDGGIFRIVDGERRYRAMKLNRKKSFTANVCEDLDEVNTIMAMMATDNKQPLTDIEKSRGVQQMLLLGVEPTKVDKTVKGVKSKRIKKAMDKVQDAAEDMSLDRLLAIVEFEDDQKVVDELTNCREDEWERIADNARRERSAKKRTEEIRAALIERGYQIVDSRPDGYYYNGRISSVKEVESLTDDPDAVVFDVDTTYHVVDKLVKRTTNEEDAELESREARLRDELRESEERVEVWFGSHLNDPSSMPIVAKMALDAFKERNVGVIDRFQDDLLIYLDCEPCKYVLAVGFSYLTTSAASYVYGIYKNGINPYYVDQINDYLLFIDSVRIDGYEPEDWELDCLDQLEESIKKAQDAARTGV